MKKISNLILIFAIFLFSGCADGFLDQTPTNLVSESLVFSTTTNAWAAINGIHRAMFIRYDSQAQAGEGAVMIARDILGEDVVMTNQGSGWFVSYYRWLNHTDENSLDVRFVWRFYYLVIGNANMIIANIDNAVGPQVDRDEIKGQALVYRAWAHFNLVQLFAQRYEPEGANIHLGVPLVLKPIIEGIPRNTVAEVYDQVNKDLDHALSLLSSRRNSKSHFNSHVVRGIMARVALTQGDYESAVIHANSAREGFPLMSIEQLYEGFNNLENPEWIWGSRQIAEQQTTISSFFAYMSLNYNSTDIRSNPKVINNLLYNQIPSSDARKKLWDPNASDPNLRDPFIDEMTLVSFAKRDYMNRKFLAEGNASSVGDVPYMRSAEMYLIEAEALAKAGLHTAAQNVLFELVSARDPEYSKSSNTGQALIEEVLLQRRIELWGEGFRFYDLKRLNLPLDRKGTNHVATIINNKFEEPAGTNNWVFRIPISEMNANDKMVQNPLPN